MLSTKKIFAAIAGPVRVRHIYSASGHDLYDHWMREHFAHHPLAHVHDHGPLLEQHASYASHLNRHMHSETTHHNDQSSNSPMEDSKTEFTFKAW